MFEFETFVYLDVPKTGSSFISEVLRRFCTEKRVRKATHRELGSDPDRGKFYFISVRDPLDQYISLYSFGCQGEGELFNRMKRLGLATLYDGTWSGFEFWLKQILDPANGFLLGKQYGDRFAALIGFQSYRVLRLAVPDFSASTAKCDTVGKLRTVYETQNIVGFTVKYENLRDDICLLLKKKLRSSMRIPRAISHVRNSPPSNPSDRVDRYEPNARLESATVRLLAEREWLLKDYFGYCWVGADGARGKTSDVARTGSHCRSLRQSRQAEARANGR